MNSTVKPILNEKNVKKKSNFAATVHVQCINSSHKSHKCVEKGKTQTQTQT